MQIRDIVAITITAMPYGPVVVHTANGGRKVLSGVDLTTVDTFAAQHNVPTITVPAR